MFKIKMKKGTYLICNLQLEVRYIYSSKNLSSVLYSKSNFKMICGENKIHDPEIFVNHNSTSSFVITGVGVNILYALILLKNQNLFGKDSRIFA